MHRADSHHQLAKWYSRFVKYSRRWFLAGASLTLLTLLSAVMFVASPSFETQGTKSPSETSGRTVGQIETSLRERAKKSEATRGMQLSFQAFLDAHHLSTGSVNYSEFVMIRLLFEATRDAGLWNLHWAITDQPPNSDRIWLQWKEVRRPVVSSSTATAECDELSALFAFLAARAGVKSTGLLWPYSNHTVAVWTVHPARASEIRVVVPTTQIFLSETDFFDTRKFNPWNQKTIYSYSRRDVPDSFVLPQSLYDFFFAQIDKYAGASDQTLQDIRYLREGVFLRTWTPEQAAQKATVKSTAAGPASKEDAMAFENFARDMRADVAAY